MSYAIETIGLSRRFGNVIALDDLSLQVPKGTVYGFLGPNGAGKTTTIKLLLGLIRPSSGSIKVLGQPVPGQDYLARIGFLPDVPSFYNWMRGDEFLAFVGRLFSMPAQKLKTRQQELLQLTGLQGVKTKIGGYSRGMKQRLGLAQALINEPELIFMDEPTSALDPLGRKEFLEIIPQLSQRCTVFFSTHILTDVERVCDQVGILKKGRLVCEESISGLQRRFARNAISLELRGNTAAFIAGLKQKFWFESVREEDNEMVLTVLDQGVAQQELPQLISKYGLALVRMEPLKTSLEDIFLRLVKQ